MTKEEVQEFAKMMEESRKHKEALYRELRELSKITENDKTLAEKLSEVCEEIYQKRDSIF